MALIDRIIYSTPGFKLGVFRCTADDPRFRDSGPIEDHIVVFPRTGVWICHEGSRPFVADPNVATVYNCGQRYTRAPLCRDGDRGDWFAVSPELAVELAGGAGAGTDDVAARPFGVEYLPVSATLYAMQRRVVELVEHGADALQIEELALAVLGEALRAARAGRPIRRESTTAHRELAMRIRAELADRLAEPLDLATLAERLGASPWHLCRVFKEQTGTTIHAWRQDLRLRAALEHLAPASHGISTLAHELGFSSHSHFTAAFRRRFGFPPSARRMQSRVAGGR